MSECRTDTTTANTVNDPASSATDLNLAYEIRCFREELGAMRDELRQFQNEMLSLKMSVSACNERMTILETKVSDVEMRFEEQRPERYDQLEATIYELKSQLNERDQELLQNDLVIAGIPETKDENKFHLVKVISTKLGVIVGEQDIVNIERIGAVRRNFADVDGVDQVGAPRPRVIAVRLARRGVRDQLLRAARVRRGLTTADLDGSITSAGGQPRRFYVNERLTTANGKLFHKARDAGQRLKYKYVWSKDGRIYVRKEDGLPAQRIRCDADLATLLGNRRV